MLNRLSLPFVCQATSCELTQKWFLSFKELMNNGALKEEEKYLWLWLTSQSCANPIEFSCSYSYFQIATILDKPCKRIHRALFRLRIMGYLLSMPLIPVWYSEPPANMAEEIRMLKPIFPKENW